MAVKIRLARRGRKKQPYYHIVIADARAPRDGRFIEQIGSYNPMTKPASIEIDRDRAYEWLKKGAQPTDTVRAILRFTGVLYKKHLMRGVAKGALTQEEADAKLSSWIADKEAKVNARKDESKAEKDAYHAMVAGLVPEKKPAKEVVVEDDPAPRKEQLTLAEEAELKAKAEAEAVESETPAPAAEAAETSAEEAEAPKEEAEAPKEEAEAPKEEADAPAEEAKAPAEEAEAPKEEPAPAAAEEVVAEGEAEVENAAAEVTEAAEETAEVAADENEKS